MSRNRPIRFVAALVCPVVMGLAPLVVCADSPSTAPTTAPAVPHVTQSAVAISPDAQSLLDAVSVAYGRLRSVDMTGTFSQDMRVGGRTHHGSATFTSSFLAPNFFRHEVKGNLVCGSTGDKAFAYNERMRLYTMGDAPTGRTAIDKLPAPLPQFVDPSLMLTIAGDPSAELTRNATEISKGADTIIDGVSYPALVIKEKDGDVLTLCFDPQTHFVHRALTDARVRLEAKGNTNVESALLTVDYTTVVPDADLKSGQFAWAPPEGARDLAAAGPAAGNEAEASALEGKDAPDFKLTGLDDKPVSLADVKGRVTILDFWATWCPPCRASLPHLAEIYAKMKGDGLKVYAVNVGEDKPTVQAFVEQTKLAVPVLLDSDSTVSQKYGASAIPETVLIGKDGKIRKVFVGFTPEIEDQIAAAAKAALSEAE